MYQISNAFDRHNRRYSSGAGTLVSPSITGYRPDPNRPSSSGKLLSKPQGASTEAADQTPSLSKQGGSVSTRQVPEGSPNDSLDNTGDGVGGVNRWSSSTTSSISTQHRRHSSFSRRLSLSGNTFSNFRSMSPTKKRRSSDAQRDPPTGQSSPTSLPSLHRFSPLTIPNLSFGSDKEEQNNDKPLPPRPPAAVEQPLLEHKPEYGQESRTLSPSRSAREPLLRAGSHLSDIQETSRAPTPTPKNFASISTQQLSESQPPKPPLRSTFSREGSPMKREPPINSTTNAKSNAHPTQPARRPSRNAEERENSNAAKPISNNPSAQSSRHPSKSAEDKGKANYTDSTSGNAPPPQPTRRPSKSTADNEKRQLLSKALDRANEAVELDNEQEYDKAAVTYEDACILLDAVLRSTKGERDIEKLLKIRGTYLTRIKDLGKFMSTRRPPLVPKPEPQTHHKHQVSITPSLDAELDREIEAEQQTQNSPDDERQREAIRGMHQRQPSNLTSRRDPGFGDIPDASVAAEVRIPRPMPRQSAIPPPLSSKRPKHPPVPSSARQSGRQESGMRPESGVMNAQNDLRTRHTSSWLNTTEEVYSLPTSPTSPNRSTSSREGLPSSDFRAYGQNTEAEFDAALDAAIESAYDDGYEPWDPDEYEVEVTKQSTNDPFVDQARSYAQREAQIQRLSQRSKIQHDITLPGDISDDEAALDTDEEDELLAVEPEFEHAAEAPAPQTSESKIPRQSGSSASSSGHSGRTWGSSAGSSLNITSTSLGTVDENASLPTIDFKSLSIKNAAPSGPPPTLPKSSELATHQELPSAESDQRSRSRSPNLRDRRLSAQKARQLRIETAVDSVSPEQSDVKEVTHQQVKAGRQDSSRPDDSKKQSSEHATKSAQSKTVPRLDQGQLSSPYPSPSMHTFPADVLTPPTPSITAFSPHHSNEQSPQQVSPDKQPEKLERLQLKQNASSASLSKQAISANRTPDEGDPSPGTPASFGFPKDQPLSLERIESALDLPMKTPVEGSFPFPATGTNAVKIFDNEIHSATLTGIPTADSSRVPKPLEPCPESVLLRPWWFMRCIYQTLSHPKGGYVTTRLFVPHDVWKVKNVKLKGVEEKIANCDLLTAALLKLSSVDTLDADAVLEEMQAFESVLDQAQANLQKKLGNEVGVASAAALFKDAPPAESSAPDSASAPHDSKGNTTSTGSRSSSRGYLNSWKKLRNKSSSTNLSGHPAMKEGQKEGYTMSSLPMTSSIESQRGRAMRREQSAASKNLSNMTIDGPNANYAGALLRLCDAVQVLDEIARQVEDPGLRHTSQTHVGLELSIRHAAEFFAAYPCRFIVQDLTLLEEKFIKRATEWILD